MIEEGYAGFTSQQWERKTGMLLIEFATFRNRLFENQLIINENRGTAIREAYYRFTLNDVNNISDAQRPIANNEHVIKHDDRMKGSDVAEHDDRMEGNDVFREEAHSEDAMAGILSPDNLLCWESACPLADAPCFPRLEGLRLLYGQSFHEPPEFLLGQQLQFLPVARPLEPLLAQPLVQQYMSRTIPIQRLDPV